MLTHVRESHIVFGDLKIVLLKTELSDIFNVNMYGPYVFTLFVNRGSNVNEEVKRNFKETLDCL